MDEATRARFEALRRSLGSRPRPLPQPAPRTVVAQPGGVWAPARLPGPAAVPEPPPGLATALADVVAAALPAVAARIPAAPAATLGRLAVPAAPHDPGGYRVRHGADAGPLLVERLLGALEMTVEELDLEDPAVLLPHVGAPPVAGSGALTVAVESAQSPAHSAVDLLGQLAPDLHGLVVGLVEQLARHDRVLPLLEVAPGVEEQMAAAHGRGHLALAVVTSALVLRAAAPPTVGAGAPAVVGVAVDAAIRVLAQRPMPAGYAAALRERRRAGYLLPRYSSGDVEVGDHRFALVEGGFPAGADEPRNGLAQVVPGGLVVRTAAESGPVRVSLQVLVEPPEEVDLSWQEVVEVSYEAFEGFASVTGPLLPGPEQLLCQTPPAPGPVRARVHARGRDELEESYEIVVWQAPAAPEVVHRATDRLGHRLRGEPEPPVAVLPEVAYRWVRDRGSLSVAATVTVVTGSTPQEVLTAFGADQSAPEPLEDLLDDAGTRPWVAVVALDGAVLAVEHNGWRGTDRDVLAAASVGGRAASAFWSATGMTMLSFARGGEVLAAFEWLRQELPTDPEVLAALEGLRYDEGVDTTAKGLAAVERFTGHGFDAVDLARLESDGVAHPIRD